MCALASDTAHAHLVSTGLGPLYDGALHVLMTPQAILLVLSLALLAGLRGPAHARSIVFALPVAWLFGVAVSQWGGMAPPSQTARILSSIMLLIGGGLLALDLRISRHMMAGLAVLLIGLSGMLAGADDTGQEVALAAVLGGGLMVFCAVALAASVSLPLTRLGAIVAVRVAGSWVAAAGLLLMGWAIHVARL